MAIYRYTLKKYLASWSTWIIAAFSFLLTFVLGGYVPFKLGDPSKLEEYAMISVISVAITTSFMSIFTSVFAGFKAATMFKDEIEDGTFLVMLSKPISRSRIILFKWLAMQTMIAGYTLFIALTYLIAIVCFDNPTIVNNTVSSGFVKSLTSQIFGISMLLWAILYVVSLIFSSIALLLSTKLSVGTTIGISIALGVIIPVTSMIGTFTSKPPYKMVGHGSIGVMEQVTKDTVDELSKKLPDELSDFRDKIRTFSKDDLSFIESTKTLYNLGFATGDKDNFQYAQALDFNYQIQKLSEFSSEQAIPKMFREQLSFSDQAGGMITTTTRVSESNQFDLTAESKENQKQFNQAIRSSWDYMLTYRRMITAIVFELVQNGEIGNLILPWEWNNVSDKNGKHLTVNGHLNEQNKKQFLDEAKDILLPYLFDTMEQAEQDGKSQEYAYANSGMWKFVLTLTKVNPWVDFSKHDFGKEVNGAINRAINFLPGYGYYAFSALDMWVSKDKLGQFISDNGITRRNILSKTDDKPRVPELKAMEYLIKANDLDLNNYNSVYSIIASGHNIVRIKSTEYTNKYTILWIYLAIAIALVPAAYLLVRKQDVR